LGCDGEADSSAEVCTVGVGKTSLLCKDSSVCKGDLPGDGGLIGPLAGDGGGVAEK